jgi:hypothetical protein
VVICKTHAVAINQVMMATVKQTLVIDIQINVREHQRGNAKINNPEKQATFAIQETGRRKAKHKAHHYTQTNRNNVKPSYK